MQKIKNACGVIDTACTAARGVIDTAYTMHVGSLTTHAKYDTECAIDEPLKRIPIKNIYVPELSFSTTTKNI
jgi:hypothetical protein